MCGIAGIFGIDGKPVVLDEVKAMCDTMIHRGPNDEGFYVEGSIGLGMRRLSIIDLSTGWQPIHNEDQSIQVVLNGEIYNYRELTQNLQSRGHQFYTRTDTEVIVHLYEEYGPDCVNHLRGMFTFALWDSRRHRLMLARDRLGIKPLFYGEFDGRLFFASELKCLLRLPDVPRDLDLASVGHLFAFNTTPKNASIVGGVCKLEPGHVLVAEPGKAPQVSRYWDVQFRPDRSQSMADCIDGLREYLKEAVRLRLISDVPLGAFLSGGIDSGAVVATMAGLSNAPVKTFSIGFAQEAYNEAPMAREVADAFGTEHHELILDPNVTEILEELAWFLDEPFGDSSAIPTYMVSKMTAEHVTVALSGDGGDELFAGYDKYLVEQKERRREQQLPRAMRRALAFVGDQMKPGMKGRNFLRHMRLEGADRYLDNNSLFKREDQRVMFQPDAGRAILQSDPWAAVKEFFAHSHGHWLTDMQYMDMHRYLPLDILTKVDRMSMAHSLEARVPLLDHKLVEYANTIPPEYLLRDGITKHVFKEAMRGILPDSTIDRRKRGFAIPLDSWFKGELGDLAHDLLLSESARSRNLFDHDYIEALLARFRAGDYRLHSSLWTLISFEQWCRTFLDRPAHTLGKPANTFRPDRDMTWQFSAA